MAQINVSFEVPTPLWMLQEIVGAEVCPDVDALL